MADVYSRSGHGYTDPKTLAWCADVHGKHDKDLENAYQAAAKNNVPQIQVGPNEGILLEWLVKHFNVSKAVEIGTLVGYSAMRISRAMKPEGHLWTIEHESLHADIAEKNFNEAGVSDDISVVRGTGKEVLRGLEVHGPFDLVFVDADKENYEFYGEWAYQNLKKGGLLIGDNAYVFGELFDDTARGKSMRRFHEFVSEHFDSVCLPTPDGMVLGTKK